MLDDLALLDCPRLDYTAGDVAGQVRESFPDGVDALINLAGFTNDDVPIAAIRAGGKVATLTNAPDAEALAAAGLTGSNIMTFPTSEILTPLVQQAAAGTLQVGIASVAPLAHAMDGLAALAAGGVHGKIVVTVAD